MARRSAALARRRLRGALAAGVSLLLAAACEPPQSSPKPISNARATVAPLDAGTACVGADAHAKHASLGYGCTTCHACGGVLELSVCFTFPGGTTTANAQVVRDGSSATCSVGCHSPLGAASPPVDWTHGPLACTDCHSNLAPATIAVHSSHLTAAPDPSGACVSCHDQSNHTSGQVRILGGDGASGDGACTSCHAGQGQTLAGLSPPLLVGWNDTVNGDFHGARLGTCSIDRYWYTAGTTKYYRTESYQPCASAGPNDVNVVPTGFGGTLKPPYVRNQDALPCDTCHDPHSSGNAFLLAANVNGTPVPAGAIDRAGVGAQALCNACHEGDRHAYCKSCHRAAMITDLEGYTYFDPASPAVDPMPDGSACFFCHGHEGLQNMKVAAPAFPSSHPNGGGDCTHCHGGWRPGPIEYAAPVIAQGNWSYVPPATAYYLALYPEQPSPAVWLQPNGTVFAVTETSASIYWETNEPATSYVAYGVVAAGHVVGYNAFATSSADPANPSGYYLIHRVDLTGLTPNTTYAWRIRTSDRFRNVTETPLQTFRTVDPDAPPAPTLVPEPFQYNSGGTGNDPWVWWVGQPLQWQPVTSPGGGAVQYRLQLTTDPTFTANAVDTVLTETSYPLSLSGPLASYVQWMWRVMAIDPATGRESIWSDVDAFGVGVGDPYTYY